VGYVVGMIAVNFLPDAGAACAVTPERTVMPESTVTPERKVPADETASAPVSRTEA
jgi:hypothetical protein